VQQQQAESACVTPSNHNDRAKGLTQQAAETTLTKFKTLGIGK